jgi:hypothetical protein
MANHSLFPRNKFAKRHYEAIAQAMQEAIQGSTSSTMAFYEQFALIGSGPHKR